MSTSKDISVIPKYIVTLIAAESDLQIIFNSKRNMRHKIQLEIIQQTLWKILFSWHAFENRRKTIELLENNLKKLSKKAEGYRVGYKMKCDSLARLKYEGVRTAMRILVKARKQMKERTTVML